MSVVSRKCGVHLLHPPTIVTSKQINMEVVQNSRKSSKENWSASYENVVEAFLDENSDFLEDYVRRKVNRLKLENWLFRRHSTTSTQHYLSPDSTSTSNLPTPRQRSRSFTPLRKLSASKFEEGGLSTPILSKTVDGQPSFLRTQPPPSSPDSTSLDSFDRKSIDRKDAKELWLRFIPDIISSYDVTSWCQKLIRALRQIFQSDRTEILILSRPNSFEGELHIAEFDEKISRTHCSANRLVTGSLTSGRTLNIENPDIDIDGYPVGSALVGPIFCSRGQRVIGSIHLYKKMSTRVEIHSPDNSSDDVSTSSCNGVEISSSLFGSDDEAIFEHILKFSGRSLESIQAKQEMRLELSRSEVFLELARTVFREPNRLEPTMLTILTNFLSLIDCERCQILLSDPDHPNVFKRVFDLERNDLNQDGSCTRETPFEGRFPINALITGEVARTGKTISLRFETDSEGSPRSIFCMPVRDPDNQVLGVISLMDKENDLDFTDNDERFAEAFSIFCGMAIRNAADYEKAVVSEAKLQVAFEVMNRFMTASEADATDLASLPVPAAASITLDSFTFNYLDMDDNDTLTASVRMFIDLGLMSRFHIDYKTLCRFLLTVKRNYRNETVKYHNWYHAFNVAQMMFATLLKTGWNKMFTETDILGLLVACICHDLDHRGTNNSFQIKTNNPLAVLYSSSTMERHHLNQCLLLLNLKGNNILENLDQEQYTTTLSVIEYCILATDLSLHFKHLAEISKLADSVTSEEHLETLVTGNDFQSTQNRFYLQSAMMTAADLGAVTKPWVVHRAVSQLLAEEFWEQGDLERKELNVAPQPMMDRHASLSVVQIGFVDEVCTDVYQLMSKFHQGLRPLLDSCLENRARWARLKDEEEQKRTDLQKEKSIIC